MKGNAKLNRRQLNVQLGNERRKTRFRLQQLHPDIEISADMVQDAMVASQCKRIATLLPVFHEKTKRVFARNSMGNKYSEVSRAIRSIPTRPLKKHVGWLSVKQQDEKSDISLTEEIQAFAKYVGLTPVEEEVRRIMLSDMQEAVRLRWGDAEVVPFGSYAAGLSIFSSDVDVAVLSFTADTWIMRSASDESDIYDHPDTFGKISMQELTAKASASQRTMIDISNYNDNIEDATNDANQFDDENEKEEDNEQVDIAWEIDRSTAAQNPNTEPLQPPKQGQTQIGVVVRSESVLGKRRRSLSNISDSSSNNKGDDHSDNNSSELSSSSSLSGIGSESDNEEEEEEDEESSHSSDLYGIGKKKRKLLPTRIDVNVNVSSAQKTRFVDQEEAISSSEAADLPVDLDLSFSHGIANSGQHEPEPLNFSNLIDLTEISNSNPFSQNNTNKYRASLVVPEQSKQRLRKVQILRQMTQTFRLLDWTEQLELRHRAKVPIIHYTHRCGVESDVSLGLNEQDTLILTQAMVRTCRHRVLWELSSFLKLFLHQLQLDEPFTGGLGSFKLYVLITAHCQRHPELLGAASTRSSPPAVGGDHRFITVDEEEDEPNTGLLLLTFLQYFGRATNLNSASEITLRLPTSESTSSTSSSQLADKKGNESNQEQLLVVTINFEVNTMIELAQQAFALAYKTLRDLCRSKWESRRRRNLSSVAMDEDQGDDDTEDKEERRDDEDEEYSQYSDDEDDYGIQRSLASKSNPQHQCSHSLLARLLVSCERLQNHRRKQIETAQLFMAQRGSETQRMQRAQLLFRSMQERYLGTNTLIKWEDCDAALQMRFLSFLDPHRVVLHWPRAVEEAFAAIQQQNAQQQELQQLSGERKGKNEFADQLANLTDVHERYLAPQHHYHHENPNASSPNSLKVNYKSNSTRNNSFSQTKKHRSRPKSSLPPSRVNSMSSLATATSNASSVGSQGSSSHTSPTKHRHSSAFSFPDNHLQNNRSSFPVHGHQSYGGKNHNSSTNNGGFGRHNVPTSLVHNATSAGGKNATLASPLRALSSQIDASIAMLKEKLREKKQMHKQAQRHQQRRATTAS